MASRLLISALIRAKGAHDERAQQSPTTPTRAVPAAVLVMKKVEHIQIANRMWERSQARRSVSQLSWQAERRRVRREWDSGEGAVGKYDMDAESVPGVPGVDARFGVEG